MKSIFEAIVDSVDIEEKKLCVRPTTDYLLRKCNKSFAVFADKNYESNEDCDARLVKCDDKGRIEVKLKSLKFSDALNLKTSGVSVRFKVCEGDGSESYSMIGLK